MPTPLALITRPLQQAGETAQSLEKEGFSALISPMLEIRLREDFPARLDEGLTGSPQALLLTSANGALALAETTCPRTLPVYAVGDRTRKAAQKAGFTHVHSADGNAGALMALIKKELPTDAGPLLYPSAEVVKADIDTQLQQNGFTVRRLIAYTALPVPAFSPRLTDALTRRKADLALFYSARTADIFHTLYQSAGLDRSLLTTVDALAISEETASALACLPWRSIQVAGTPDNESMMALAHKWREKHEPHN